jgi:gliding motility-associated-like protein
MKCFYRNLVLSVLFLLIFPFKGFSTHIVGGVITYTYNGGNNYTVSMILYRDCGAGNAAYPASVTFTVLQADGSVFAPSRNFTANGGAITSIPPTLPPCATSPSVVPCVEQRVYTTTVNLAPAPGGMHVFYSLCCRNGSILNIVNPGAAGETFYAYIPCYSTVWSEDFTLANGTTTDAGPTAWTRTLGITPPTSAQVNTGQFEIIGSNNGSAIWASQIINISAYPSGVNLSANLDRAGANYTNNDSLKIYYSINSGAKVLFPVNGSNVNAWAAPRFATATGLVGNTIQIFVTSKFSANNNSTGKTFDVDMVNVYNNTFLPNSSPYFNSLPPLIFCATNSFSINCSATDADGDNLVYSMYTPYNDTPNPPLFPDNTLSVNPVVWQPGYSATSPFNSPAPSVTLNPGTGYMTGVANTNGQFVFGVKVSEYRSGVLLSEVVRDYQGNTVTCPPFVPPPPTAGANTPLCVGQTLSLTASTVAGATYSWTGPNSFSSTLQNPTIGGVTLLASGVYSVHAIVAGCTGIAGTVAVTVNPNPAAPTASGNTPLCAGSVLSLTASTIAGGTYNWAGPNSFTSTTQNPTIPGITVAGAGTYSVNATVGGCTSPNGTVAIVVNALPAAPTATANTPLCVGQTLNLGASTIAGATYTWNGPNAFTSALQNPSIAGITVAGAGTYSVRATVGGCIGPIGTVAVVVNPLPAAPTATANTPLCVGQTLNLGASTIAGATYNWAGPNSFTSTTQNPSIAGITLSGAGVYSVNAVALGCTGPAGTINVVVNPLPAAPTATANTPLCVGQTLNLGASTIAGATYSWNGPNTFSSASQNPSIPGITVAGAGVYSVNASVLGCVGPNGTVSVVVNPLPAAPAAGANTPLCSGQTLSLTASAIAGATYNWSGPNSFTSTTQNPTIVGTTTLASGTYTVNATVSGCAGPNGTVAVVVNQTPIAATAGANTPLCSGQTLSLTASTVAGATYNWTGPNSFTSTAQNPTIVGTTTLASGTYSVNVTVAGCTGANGTVAVVVNQTPSVLTIGANSPLCSGQTLSLTSTSTVGATFSWSGPNSFTSTAQNPTIVGTTTLASGIYTVIASVGGCASATKTINVVVNQTPIVLTIGANSPLCSGQTLSLTATSTVGATFNWSGPNSFTSTTQNPTIVGATTLAAGVYSVTSSIGGCTSSNGTVNVVVNQTPTVLTIGANSPLCSGQTLSLTATSTVGATFSWSGPNSFTSTVQNPTIVGATTIAAGVYSVTSSIGGCTSSNGTVNVVVNQTPSILTIGANSPLCSGQTLSLTSTSTVGATFSWTGPNSFTSTAQNPTIVGATTLAAGVYSVTSSIGGCTSSNGTVNVVINQTPSILTIGANSPLCSGQTLSLTATSTVGATFNWSGPNSFTSTAQNPTIVGATTLAAGVYSVTSSIGGCTSSNGTVNVVVNQTPTVLTIGANSPLCSGQTLSLTATSTVGATFNWSGPNSFTSTTQNPTIVGTTTLASGVYSVNASIGGCASAVGTVNVVVNQTPSIPLSMSSNAPICEGQTLNLSTSAVAGGTYSWSGPNSFTSTVQNPSIVSTTSLASGVYSLNVTVAGCTSPTGTLNVLVNPLPASVVAGSNSPLCAGQTLSLTASNIVGAVYNWSGPLSFTSSIQNPTIPGATTAMSGTYSVNVTVAGCTGSSGTVSVLVSPPVIAPTAGSNSPICEGQPLLLTASTIAGATYNWVGPNTFTASVQNPTVTPTTTLSAGIYSVQATVAGCTGPFGTISVTVNPTPAPPATVGSNAPLCEGQTLLLTSSSVAGATYSWTGPNSFTSSVQNPTIAPTTSLSAGVYSVNVTVGGCTSRDTTINVIVNPLPTVSVTAGSNAPLCIGATLSLTATFFSGATYSWTGPLSFTSSVQNPTIGSISLAASGIYSVSITVAGCSASSASTVNVVVAPPVPAPTAGGTSPICEGQPIFLTASTIASATYSWTGPNSYTATTQNATVMPTTTLSAGVYSVTANVGGCTSPEGTVAIVVNPTPFGQSISSNAPICEGQTLLLNVSTIAGATYSWTGPNSFTSTVQNPTITPTSSLSAGVYSVNITVGGCTSADSTLNVVINPIPLAPSASANTPLCAGSTVSLTAGTMAGATYSWTGPNTFTSNIQNPTIPGATTLATGVYSVNVSIAGCTGPDGTVSILVTDPAVVNAGPNGNVCSTAPFVTLSGTVTPGYTTTWTTLGTGTLLTPGNLNTNYIMSNADTTAGSITFILTASGGGCPSVSDTVVYNILPAANTNAGPNQNVCKNAVIPLSGNITGVTTTGYWTSTGTGTFFADTTASAIYYQPSSADTTGNQTIYLILTSTNNGGCAAAIDTLIATFINAPKSAFSYSTACATYPVQFTDLSTPTSSLSTFFWDFGDASSNGSQNPVHTYSVGGSYTVTHVVTSLNGCTDTVRQVVPVFIAPIPAFSYTNACVGTTASFNDLSTLASGTITSWNWSFGDGGTATTQNTTHIYSVTASYSVTLSVTSSNGCTTSTTQVVNVNPKPNAEFSMSGNPIFADETLGLTDQSTPLGTINSWQWAFGDGVSAVTQNTSHLYDDKGVFTITLSIIDINGCADTVTHDVFVTLLPLVPTGFSPNGDGHNDTLFVKGGPFKSFYFRVYNNWGEKVFESTKQEDGWDGKYKGQVAPLGAYAWILDVELYNDNNRKIRKTGDVTIVK